MPYFDMPLDELKGYKAPDSEPKDFDLFWKRTLDEARAHPLAPRFEPLEDPIYALVDVFDVDYSGFGGQRIKGWLIFPRRPKGPMPCIVTFRGYGNGRSLPVDHLVPIASGFAHFVMDTRGQGSASSPGQTPDNADSGPQFPGFMTRGIESPESYYYRRAFIDGARAVEAVATHSRVDPDRIAVSGSSQGGGIALAAAAIVPESVHLVMVDVPFLCHFRRAVEITDQGPYNEITSYLRIHRDKTDQVFKTLDYFDGVNFAPRIKAWCLFSLGMMDMVCPPSTVFAVYNRITSNKEIKIYEFNEHDGGGPFQDEERLRFALKHL